jgi:hypothetical protein
MKYFYQVMIFALIFATLASLIVIVASFFLPVYTLYMWVALLVLSAGSLFGYVKLKRC